MGLLGDDTDVRGVLIADVTGTAANNSLNPDIIGESLFLRGLLAEELVKCLDNFMLIVTTSKIGRGLVFFLSNKPKLFALGICSSSVAS